MTVSSSASEVSYSGNGATVAFAVPFRYLAEDDLVVTLGGTPLARGVDYSVTAPGASGTVTLTAAPADGAVLTITRETARAQGTALPTQGPFSPRAVEAALDRAVLLAQDEARERLAVAERATSLESRAAAVEGRATSLETRATSLEDTRASYGYVDLAVGQAAYAAGAVASTSAVLATGGTSPRTLADIAADTVMAKNFGVLADGVKDDTDDVQKAIDYALQNKKGRVKLPPGLVRITKPLHLGYGTSFTKIDLEGDGRRYRGESGIGGTAILAEHSNAPAINVQGARQARIAHLSIIGPNFAHVKDNVLGKGALALLDDSVRANWVAPGLHANADSRYAPCAGIAVDAYAGVRPGTSYPDVAYPAWVGATPQWGKALTNVLTMHDVEVAGFVAGLVTHPSGSDGNGDFIGLTDCAITHNVVAISISHTQCRQVQARNVRIDNNFIALSNTQHGQQTGEVDGHFTGCSFDRVEYMLELTTSRSMPCTFVSCYAELLTCIGNVSTNTADNNPLTFVGCHFNFPDGNEKAVPLHYLTSAGAQPVLFQGCRINVPRSFGYVGDVSLDNCEVRITAPGADFGAAVADRLAIDAGRSVFPSIANVAAPVPPRLVVKTRQYASVASSSLNSWLADLHNLHAVRSPNVFENVFNRDFPWPCWAPKRNGWGEDFGGNVGATINRATTPLASVAVSGIDFTVDVGASRAAGSLNEALIGAGDLVYDATTGARFFVASAAGSVLVLRLLNGYKKTGGVFSTTVAMALGAGSLHFICSRVYCLPYPTFGDVTSASNVITNLGRGDSFGTYISAVQVGDFLLSFTSAQEKTGHRKIFNSPAKVTAVDSAARTITLDKNASRTAALAPFNFWLRAP